MSSNVTKRWDYMDSATRSAIQRSAHKWSYQDFADCFPLWTSENLDGSVRVYQAISEYLERAFRRELQKLFNEYGDVQDNIILLHRLVEDAKARKDRDETRKDIWRDELEPRAAICARTVPQLEEETRRMKETLSKLEDDNDLLIQELRQTAGEDEQNNAKANQLLQDFDSILKEWAQLPEDEIEEWARKTLEGTEHTMRA